MRFLRRRMAVLLAVVMTIGSLPFYDVPVYAALAPEQIGEEEFSVAETIPEQTGDGLLDEEGLLTGEDELLNDIEEEGLIGDGDMLLDNESGDGVPVRDDENNVVPETETFKDIPEASQPDAVKFCCGSYSEESGSGYVAAIIEVDKVIKYQYKLELVKNGAVIKSVSSNGRKDALSGQAMSDPVGYKMIWWNFTEDKPDTVRLVISDCTNSSLNGAYTVAYKNDNDVYPKSGTWYTSDKDHGRWSINAADGQLLIEGLGSACSCVQQIGFWNKDTWGNNGEYEISEDSDYTPWSRMDSLGKLSSLKITGQFNSTYWMTGGNMKCGIKSADLTGLRIVGDNASMNSMFYSSSDLENIDFGSIDTSLVKDMSYMFYTCASLTELDLSSLDMSNVTSCDHMFEGCRNLVSIKAPKNVKTPIELPGIGWYNASTKEKVSAIPVGVTAGTEYRFSCAGSGTIDTGYLKGVQWSMDENGVMTLTGKVTAAHTGEEELSGGLSGGCPLPNYEYITKAIVKIEDARNLSALFWGCEQLKEVDLSKLDTSQVWNMYGMFYHCPSLTSVDLSNMDMGKITGSVIGYINGSESPSMSGVEDMFFYCSSLTSIKAPKNLKYDIELPTFSGYKDYTWKQGTKEAPAGRYGQKIPANVAAGTVFTRVKSSVTPAPSVTTEKAAAPTANHMSGEVKKNTRVFLSSTTQGADIYYTLNGSAPALGSDGKPLTGTVLYADAITIDKTMTIKAIAVKKGFDDSDMVTYDYTIKADWGDVTDTKVKELFGNDALKVPEGMWYLFGEEDKFSYYTKAGNISFNKVFTGSAVTFNNDIGVFFGTTRLWENRDYSVTYKNNIKAADAKAAKAPMVTVKGKGNYAGQTAFRFTISGADMNEVEITSEPVMAIAAGTKLNKIKPTVEFEGKKLALNKDYDLVYYEGSVAEANRRDPAQTAAATGKTYIIQLKAHESGNFAGTKTNGEVTVKTFAANDKSVVQVKSLKVTIPKQPWSGKAISVNALFDNSGTKDAPAKVMRGSTRLVYGTDFTVVSDEPSYADAGKYRVIIRGTAASVSGNRISYVGDRNATLEITGISSGRVKIACLSTTVEYNDGRSISLNDLYKTDKNFAFKAVTLYTKQGGTVKELKPDADYEYSFVNTGCLGKTELEFTLKGGYSGTIKKKVTVKPYNISNKKDIRKKITVSCAAVEFSKAGAVPDVTVRYGNTILNEGTDYRLSFRNNAKAALSTVKGAPTVYVKGIGNYTGMYTKAFTVDKADAGNVKLVAGDKEYRNAKGNFKVTPKLMDNGKTISQGKGKDVEKIKASDFYYYYADSNKPIESNAIVSANTLIRVCVKVTCSDKSSYKETKDRLLSGYYRIIEPGKNISKSKVEVLKPGIMSYSGNEEIIPLASQDLKVTMDKGKTVLLPGSDYEILSITDNRFVGTATVTIAGKGKYGGTKSFKVKIKARSL